MGLENCSYPHETAPVRSSPPLWPVEETKKRKRKKKKKKGKKRKEKKRGMSPLLPPAS
jgi:hypothetical protein